MEINKIKLFGLSYFKLLFLFHIFLVSLLFFYIGFARKNTANWVYNFLLALSVVIVVYHVYRLVTGGLKESFWNYFHIFLVVPLFLVLFYYKSRAPDYIYDLFIGFGAMALFINVYFMFSH